MSGTDSETEMVMVDPSASACSAGKKGTIKNNIISCQQCALNTKYLPVVCAWTLGADECPSAGRCMDSAVRPACPHLELLTNNSVFFNLSIWFALIFSYGTELLVLHRAHRKTDSTGLYTVKAQSKASARVFGVLPPC